MHNRATYTRVLCLLAVWGAACTTAAAEQVERVVLQREGRRHTVEGRLLLTAQDGGVLLMARDGELWAIPPDEQVERTALDRPFEPLTPEELSSRLLAELPAGFDVHHTANYVILYDTSRAYAQWCG